MTCSSVQSNEDPSHEAGALNVGQMINTYWAKAKTRRAPGDLTEVQREGNLKGNVSLEVSLSKQDETFRPRWRLIRWRGPAALAMGCLAGDRSLGSMLGQSGPSNHAAIGQLTPSDD